MKTYVVYCDESIKKGRFFSNFYGGALIDNRDFDSVAAQLNRKKEELNLYGEIKWTKMSAQYLDKYIEFINYYFTFIRENKIKIRIMFKHNYLEAVGLSEDYIKNDFYMLYYQFFKNAFGFQYSNDTNEDIYLKIYFDKLPNSEEQNTIFKNWIYNLQEIGEFKHNKINIRREDITDVDSHRHVILQGMDIILGSIQFRLNDEHKVKDAQTGKRGKKTIAKEKLYKVILNNIREFYPYFNPGISTGIKGDITSRWSHPYRHWEFISSNSIVNVDMAKHK